MTREEAIIILTNTASLLRDGTKYFKPEHEKQFREAYEMAIKALEEPEQRWTPCSNTVDIPDYDVLCCDKCGNELIGWLFYSNNQWICESDSGITYDTIAWMPLPKPYRKEGEQDG